MPTIRPTLLLFPEAVNRSLILHSHVLNVELNITYDHFWVVKSTYVN